MERLTTISRDKIDILQGDLNSSHTENGGHSDAINGNELKWVIDEYGLSYVPNKQYTFLSRCDGDRDNTHVAPYKKKWPSHVKKAGVTEFT